MMSHNRVAHILLLAYKTLTMLSSVLDIIEIETSLGINHVTSVGNIVNLRLNFMSQYLKITIHQHESTKALFNFKNLCFSSDLAMRFLLLIVNEPHCKKIRSM